MLILGLITLVMTIPLASLNLSTILSGSAAHILAAGGKYSCYFRLSNIWSVISTIFFILFFKE